jgi:hypothetical protein
VCGGGPQTTRCAGDQAKKDRKGHRSSWESDEDDEGGKTILNGGTHGYKAVEEKRMVENAHSLNINR